MAKNAVMVNYLSSFLCIDIFSIILLIGINLEYYVGPVMCSVSAAASFRRSMSANVKTEMKTMYVRAIDTVSISNFLRKR